MFDNLLAKKENCDDILIINNGRVTDTSYCNVVFSDGEKFLTSSTPLLRGTKREKLIREKIIKEEEITLKDLRLFKKAILINAMIDIDDNIEVSTENII
jgi:4-amino-4-deoxychorismate lyase